MAPLTRRRKKKLGTFQLWQIYHLTRVSKPSWNIPERNKRQMLSLGLLESVLFLCIFFVFSKVCEMMPVDSVGFTYLFLAFQLILNFHELRTNFGHDLSFVMFTALLGQTHTYKNPSNILWPLSLTHIFFFSFDEYFYFYYFFYYKFLSHGSKMIQKKQTTDMLMSQIRSVSH